MNSLWLSLTDDTDHPAIHDAIRMYLDGWLASHLVSEVLGVITELVARVGQSTGHRGELILSRHDNSLLIEVVDRSERPAPLSDHIGAIDRPLRALTLRSCTWGTHSTTVGTVAWVAMPFDDGSQ